VARPTSCAVTLRHLVLTRLLKPAPSRPPRATPSSTLPCPPPFGASPLRSRSPPSHCPASFPSAQCS
jgi:hypothetical protein